jgi:hypothetical protein
MRVPSRQVRGVVGHLDDPVLERARAVEDPAPPVVVAEREELVGPENPAVPVAVASDRALRGAAVVQIDAAPQADEIGRAGKWPPALPATGHVKGSTSAATTSEPPRVCLPVLTASLPINEPPGGRGRFNVAGHRRGARSIGHHPLAWHAPARFPDHGQVVLRDLYRASLDAGCGATPMLRAISGPPERLSNLARHRGAAEPSGASFADSRANAERSQGGASPAPAPAG